jgi:hypothetical protein
VNGFLLYRLNLESFQFLIKHLTPEKVLVHQVSRTVAMEVRIRQGVRNNLPDKDPSSHFRGFSATNGHGKFG